MAIKQGEVTKVFEAFGDRLRKNVRDNLKVLGKSGGRLEKRIFHKTKEFKSSWLFEFSMEDYAQFVDKGVKGVGGTRKYKDGKKLDEPIKWVKKKVTNNKFSYKRGGKNNIPGPSHFDKWTVRKGLAPRQGGRFTTRTGLKFAIGRTVYHEGIETTNFLTEPFERGFKTLPDEVVEAYALDVERFFETSIQ